MIKIALTTMLAIAPAFANANANLTSCFPENNLHLEDDIHRKDANMTEVEFNQIITKIMNIYQPFFSIHNATLGVDRNWTDSTVNAYASQTGNTWTVSMFGGLARRPETTADGFALVVCHEIGHHLAGFPLKGGRWASTEGQSDYFATQSCARKIWADEPTVNATYRNTIDGFAKDKCDSVWSNEAEQNLCYRSAMAGKSLATLLGALDGASAPRFDTPDQSTVTTTFENHPEGQCRMDTYFSGALCNVEFNDQIIPGKNHPDGQDSIGAEQVASMNSCTEAGLQSTGLRSRCWYAPKLSLTADPAQVALAEVNGNGDNVWDPGETFEINMPITNNLLVPLTTATLEITDVESGSIFSTNYPEIGVGQTLNAASGVQITADAAKQCGDKLAVTTKVTAGAWSKSASIDFPMGGFASIEQVSDAPAVAIPDNNAAGVSTTLQGNSNENIGRVSVTLDITHTYIGDLKVTLVSPSNKEYVIHNRTGGSNDNIKGTFPVDLTNEVASGTWTLKIVDGASQDSGKLNKWELDFSGYTCNPL